MNGTITNTADGILEVSRPETTDDFPRVPTGTKIRRENGKIYTIAEDGGWLYDRRGRVVNPFTLKRVKNKALSRVLVLGVSVPDELFE